MVLQTWGGISTIWTGMTLLTASTSHGEEQVATVPTHIYTVPTPIYARVPTPIYATVPTPIYGHILGEMFDVHTMCRVCSVLNYVRQNNIQR